jgi:hypothetical protein
VRAVTGLAIAAIVIVSCSGTSDAPRPVPTSTGAAPSTRAATATTTSSTEVTVSTVATSATAPATTAAASGLADLHLIGAWYHHGMVVAIRADGSGSADWRTYRACPSSPPPCDETVGNQIMSGGHATFTVRPLGQSSNAVATMMSSNDPSTLAAAGTLQVSPVLGRSGPGNEIVFPIIPDPSLVLCDTAALPTGDCGA